jgi:hypothetical protein
VRDPVDETVEGRLRLFVRATDPDGDDDFSALFLIHDGAELYWTLQRSQWTRSETQGETWFGSYALRLPEGVAIPSGSYRVLLQDVSGEVSEVDRWIDPPKPDSLSFPSSPPGRLPVLSPGDEIWAYAIDGTFLGRRSREALEPVFWNGVSSYFLYRFDERNTVDLLTGPYRR